MRTVVIAGAARMPIGGFQGALSEVTAPALGGMAIRAAMAGAGIATVDKVPMGCVLPAGQGQAPARQAGFVAGLGEEAPATTLNKICGSGMKAAMMAFDQIALGHAGVMAAAGMESMSNAPCLLPAIRSGARIGPQQAVDSLFLDGLEDAYDTGRLMGSFAEACAGAFGVTRADQDAYALLSLENALTAQRSGAFASEIAPVALRDETVVAEDEEPGRARPDRIAALTPAFRDGGTVTAANSSSISDGAAALVIAAGQVARARGLPVRARIQGHASHAQAPGLFPTAPVPAALRLLRRLGWRVDDVDLWEVNEAFAVVPMAFMQEMGVPHERMNVNGGARSLGHPIGASGARILMTLLNALEARGLRRGVAAIGIGGGEGTALAIERG